MRRTLLDPKPRISDGPAEYPFEWKPPLATDVRATWDRLCPGWRDRKPHQPTNVKPIRKVKHG